MWLNVFCREAKKSTDETSTQEDQKEINSHAIGNGIAMGYCGRRIFSYTLYITLV